MSVPSGAYQLGTAVLLDGAAVAEAYWLVSLGRRAVSLNGYTDRPGFEELQCILKRATEAHRQHQESRKRHDDVAQPPLRADSEQLIGTTEVADILGVGLRQVQRIARSLDGRRIGTRWVFDRDAVRAYHAAAIEHER
ncbi:helix-turn-helix domain-containing protein [Aldersonia kunmingensis]|uniref:helix-turn-helix domain-containing protein n=1 Tax=Aldersonia kunmingensis TaxID=408066 RepID=UPI00083442DC|nr:helix-turn-helix domain-containing protein [Aldersonia kunmingensis]